MVHLVLDNVPLIVYYGDTMKLSLEYGRYDLSNWTPHSFLLGVYTDVHIHEGKSDFSRGTLFAVAVGFWYFGVIIRWKKKF